MEYLRRRLGREQVQTHSLAPLESTAEEDIPLTRSQDIEEEDFDVIQDCVPIRFLENRIRTLSRTSVPHDLCRLAQHMENMRTFVADGDWGRLNTEQVNASRTVQQLKSHLQTMDELRQQVRHSDLATFDRLTDAIRTDILSAVQDYQATTDSLETRGMAGGVVDGGMTEEGVTEEGMAGEEGQRLLAMQREALHYKSLEDLRADLLDLNDLVKHLNTTANAHSDRVDMLNRRTEQAAASVHGGVVNLQGGQRLKGYVLPVGGAIVGGVLGGVVGGPVGAVAGLKIGALAAATAGTAGVLGGAFIGYRVNKSNAEATRRENANSPPTALTTHPTASHRKAD